MTNSKDSLFNQYLNDILNGQIIRMANIEYANKYYKAFQETHKDIIMIKEGVKQHFMLKSQLNKFKKDMLFQKTLLEREIKGVEDALNQIETV